MDRHAYLDFDEFAAAISGVNGQFVPTAPSTAEWWIERQTLGVLELQRLQLGAASTFAGDGIADTVSLWVPLDGTRGARVDGHALDDSTVLWVSSARPFTIATRTASSWASIVMPASMQSEAGLDALTEADGVGAVRLHVVPQALEALKEFVGGEMVAESDEAHASELVRELLRSCDAVIDRHVGRPQLSRMRVIARCLEVIDANDGQPLFIQDLCAAAEVSERTLRNIFQEYFGVGPMRLLKVRQLREIRSALLRADPVNGTVTGVAARFGVWDFSLFARNYRALYGMSPSQTLRGPRQSGPQEFPGSTWMGFAARRFMPGNAHAVSEAGESR